MLYFLIGVFLAFVQAHSKDEKLDIDKESVLYALSWPKLIWNILVN